MKQCQVNWFRTAVGRSMNPDRAYNLTCVDVMNDYAEAIFGVPWHVAVGGVGGAKELLQKANPKYWVGLANREDDQNWIPLSGDVVVYGKPGSWGHTFVVESATSTTITGIEQNGAGESLVPAARVTRPYSLPAAGPVLGWLRPRAEMVIGGGVPASANPHGHKLLTVTADVAVVRTSPRVEPGNIAPAYREGIARGAKVAVVGYVSGQDPYPNDGVVDDAWAKTVSGYYIWLNGLGNSLEGLAKL